MRKEFWKTFFKNVLFLILVHLTYSGMAQDDATRHDKPYMWTPYDPKTTENFAIKKLPLLNSHTGIIQPSSFRLKNFLGMINYFSKNYPTFECLHVYIASQRHHKKELTLIFAPASAPGSAKETDLDYFVVPTDMAFDETHVKDFEINKRQSTKWRNKYIKKVMPAILQTIDDDPDNKIGGNLSETRCITYCKRDLMELVAEQTYKHKDLSNLREILFSKDMLVTFAAFGDNGNGRRMGSGKKRLYLEFDFLDNNGYTIHLEDTYGFWDRNPKGKDPRRDYCSICIPPQVLDNGTLCPPCVNCPPGTPGCDK